MIFCDFGYVVVYYVFNPVIPLFDCKVDIAITVGVKRKIKDNIVNFIPICFLKGIFCYEWNYDRIFTSNKACVYWLVVRARFVIDTKIA